MTIRTDADRYKIDNNIPLPSSREYRYPFADMDIGDSIFVPTAVGRPENLAGYANSRHPERKFVGRTRTEGGVAGYRVWRTE